MDWHQRTIQRSTSQKRTPPKHSEGQGNSTDLLEIAPYKKALWLLLFIALFSLVSLALYSTASAEIPLLELDSYQEIDPQFAVGEGTTQSLGSFLSFFVKLTVGLSILVAVVMLIYGGVKYVAVDTFSGKASGKEIIQNSLLGLILLLTSFLMLILINPRILRTDVTLVKTDVSSCSQIQSNFQEKGSHLNRWMKENKEWEWSGGPYTAVDRDVTKDDSGNISSNLECAADRSQCIDLANSFNKDDEGANEGDGIYAKCLSCTSENCIEIADFGNDGSSSRGLGLEGEQVFLFSCEAVNVKWKQDGIWNFMRVDCDEPTEQERDTNMATEVQLEIYKIRSDINEITEGIFSSTCKFDATTCTGLIRDFRNRLTTLKTNISQNTDHRAEMLSRELVTLEQTVNRIETNIP